MLCLYLVRLVLTTHVSGAYEANEGGSPTLNLIIDFSSCFRGDVVYYYYLVDYYLNVDDILIVFPPKANDNSYILIYSVPVHWKTALLGGEFLL